MLKITFHESTGTMCLKLEGSLKGAWVPEMERDVTGLEMIEKLANVMFA